jgi:hypothetical protein
MKKTQKNGKAASARGRRFFGVTVLAGALVLAGAVVGFAKYRSANSKTSPAAASKPANFVTVEVGGRKIQVNANALQQGPLSQEQAQQIADALQNNKSTEGLVEVQHADGTVEMDLQGRFQNVMLAKKNDDGTVSQACVDTPEGAKAFLQNPETTSVTDNHPRKAALQQ